MHGGRGMQGDRVWLKQVGQCCGREASVRPSAGLRGLRFDQHACRRVRRPAQGQGSLSYRIDLFGGLRRGAEAATEEEQAAEAEHLGTRVSVVAEAADAYMQIRGTQARLIFTKEQIATDEHLLQLVSQRKAAGIASDREQAQAEAVLAQARATVPQLKIILEAQLNRLDVLIGVQPGAYAAELAAPSDIPVIPAITALANPSELLRRRPDIIAAERRVAASNARIGQALAEYYPKISLSGFLGTEAIG